MHLVRIYPYSSDKTFAESESENSSKPFFLTVTVSINKFENLRIKLCFGEFVKN